MDLKIFLQEKNQESLDWKNSSDIPVFLSMYCKYTIEYACLRDSWLFFSIFYNNICNDIYRSGMSMEYTDIPFHWKWMLG